MNVVDSGERVPGHLAVVVWRPAELTQEDLIGILSPAMQQLMPWNHYGVFEDEDDELFFEFEAYGRSAIGRTSYCAPQLSSYIDAPMRSIDSGMKELPRG